MKVRVHFRGKNPNKSAKLVEARKCVDGFLYIQRRGRFWRLSNPSPEGWRSINVGMPLSFNLVPDEESNYFDTGDDTEDHDWSQYH